MFKITDTESFIQKARSTHGDIYDYSKVKYVNAKTKVCIICPIHGEFWQKPSDHACTGHKCPECAKIKRGLSGRLSKEEVINRIIDLRGNKFNFSKFDYQGFHSKTTLICKEHGEFIITPANALDSRTKEICPYCDNHSHYVNLEHFILRARKTHGDKYDYSKVELKTSNDKVCIICPEHGEFWQTPGRHIYGDGCPACGQNLNTKSKSEEEIENLLIKYNIKYVSQKAIPSKVNPSGWLYADFYLPELNTIVEYNGEQHYRKVNIWEKHYDRQQARDEELRQYCKDNNIKLIEIRYDEDVWEKLNNEIICK